MSDHYADFQDALLIIQRYRRALRQIRLHVVAKDFDGAREAIDEALGEATAAKEREKKGAK